MLSLDVSFQFIAVAALLSLVPGPDNLFVLMQSALQGSKAGLAVTLGLCTGLIFHTTAVAFGVAALVATSAVAFTLIKILGAIYLLYLAYGAFKAGTPSASTDSPRGTSAQLYRRGVLMNITNPKVAIFFLAFLPQFVAIDAGPVSLQMLQLGVLFMATTFVVFSVVALLAGRLSDWLRSTPRAISVANKVAGVVFVALAAKLLTTSR